MKKNRRSLRNPLMISRINKIDHLFIRSLDRRSVSSIQKEFYSNYHYTFWNDYYISELIF